MYKYIFFDLDGTITDPAEGITNSAKYALKQCGIIENNYANLLKFIGPPLHESFIDFYNFSKEEAEIAVKEYRKHYLGGSIFECSLYENIMEVFTKLNKLGYQLVIATCKPYPFAIKVLDYFDITKYFKFVSGATLDGSISSKSEVIKNALNNLDITDTSEVLMIGDRSHDVLGAKSHNIDCIGVLYGYGSYQEFIDCNCKYIVKTPLEILEIIKNS